MFLLIDLESTHAVAQRGQLSRKTVDISQPALAYLLEGDGELEPGVCLLQSLTVDLPGGLVGYYQRNFDDCLRAATATVTQIPYEDVVEIPAAAVEHTDHTLGGFALARGLEMDGVCRSDPPETHWLAISEPIVAGAEGFTHCFAYRGTELLFDPFGFVRPDGRLLRDELPMPAIAYGIHFYERTN